MIVLLALLDGFLRAHRGPSATYHQAMDSAWLRLSALPLCTLSMVLMPACGGGGAQGEGSSDTMTTSGITSLGETGTSMESSTTNSSTTEASTTEASTTEASTTEASTTDASTTDDTDTDTDTAGTKFDLGIVPDAGMGECGTGGGNNEDTLSYIWIANSSQNTISKINTKTMIEEGRYYTRPDQLGSPSRTSVNLGGDVAVANRNGGITKVIANVENCDEMANGQPGLQTSSGANDILPWGQDDCVAWHTPLNYSANRPAAWTFGEVNPATCEVTNSKFWTGASPGAGLAHAIRLNGDTGAIEDDIALNGFTVNSFGPYGGAVDPDENFWMISHSTNSSLIRVNADDLSYDIWPVQPGTMFSYGFTIDEYGRPWIGGAGGSNMTLVFDPETEEFTMLAKGGLGMGQASDGLMWQAMFSSQNGVRAWDIDTLEIVTEIDIPVSSSRGVSVDIDGYVWFVEVGTRAFKINPEDESYETFNGLVGAYTYSDMTGNALSIVAGGIAG